jgi:hypothetical protein
VVLATWQDARVSGADLTVEYATEADGPTLRLIATPQGVAFLQAVFRRLAAGEGRVLLQDGAGVRLRGIDGVELRCQGGDFRLRRVGRRGQPSGFIWAGDAERWRSRAELVDPLVHGQSGFQYLDYDGAGDATVVVECRR